MSAATATVWAPLEDPDLEPVSGISATQAQVMTAAAGRFLHSTAPVREQTARASCGYLTARPN